jgi:Flp pilus assembly protein TadB
MTKGPSGMAPSGTGRMIVALAVLGILALLAWRTIDPGKVQQLAFVLLAFFAFRVLIGWQRARKME